MWQTVQARLMESQIWCPLLCGFVEGSIRKGAMASAWEFYLGERCSPALILMPDTSFLPHMPLVSFKLLPQHWSSKGVSLSKFMCGSFKINCLGIQRFLPLTQSPLVFITRSYGDLTSWHRNPGLGGSWCRAWTPRFQDISPNFYPPHVSEEPAHSTPPPLQPWFLL